MYYIMCRSVIVMIFPVLAWKDHDNITSTSNSSALLPDTVENFNMAGFILQAVFQAVATFLLFLALDHERRFRSSGKQQGRGGCQDHCTLSSGVV